MIYSHIWKVLQVFSRFLIRNIDICEVLLIPNKKNYNTKKIQKTYRYRGPVLILERVSLNIIECIKPGAPSLP